jgi:hypothetical protein
MYIVRTISSTHPRGGSSYMVEASRTYGSKYRLSKTRKTNARVFKTRRAAARWADYYGGTAVTL